MGCPNDDEYAAPKYDVIIANSVAYEGVDLQRRTCQIHHIDLPWEPATLQQRNGRGVRQGALAAEVKVTYYLARGSLDARRLVKIDTKQSWMKSLVSSQDRVTNNPAAGSDLSVAEMIAELSSPAQRAKALAWAEEDRLAQEAARRQRTARAANNRLVAAMDRFHRAGRSEPATAERLRREAEAILVELGTVAADSWPWHRFALAVRDQPAIIGSKGPPLFTGTRVQLWGTVFEVGRVDGPIAHAGGIPLRKPGELVPLTYDLRGADLEGELAALEPGRIGPSLVWPETIERLRETPPNLSSYQPFPSLGLLDLPPDTLDALWPTLAPAVAEWAKSASSVYRRAPEGTELLPVLWHGALRVVGIKDVKVPLNTGAQLLPPTTAGWEDFLRRLPAAREAEGERKVAHLEALRAARYWWDRVLPAKKGD